ncbi:MAG TPA: SpoIIE family protein phosphatase [Verrucomicrobiae bacterium]|jgi:sigma-B regulation protein RsbU (phosphoserine phosphatase)|nr:SpoIIE family protein phosphatase [Verrucomicrobiae bacterium]
MLIGLASDLLYYFVKAGRIMESESLKILFIGSDEPFARSVAGMLGGTNELVTAPTMDAGTARLSGNHPFHAILFELPAVDKDGLLQVGLLSVKKPRLPIVVFGPVDDEEFATEIVRAGAQDYLVKNQFDAHLLQHTIHCAMERQHERSALIEEKDNYYGVFDHLVEGIFRTTPDGHYLLANIALAKIYGYESPVELMARITDIAHRLYVEAGRREEFVQLMQANDTITGFESKIYRKDETIIWISENCRAVRDALGNILYYEGTVEDITERKYAEEQIRRTTAELSRSREELRAKNQLMEDNLRMAREIQNAMLPQQYPVFPKNLPPEQSTFQFAHRYQPAEAISGDFFSVTQISDTEVGVFICDVAGHGVRAALVTAMIRALAEELKPLAREPGYFLRKLNSDLSNILKTTGSPMLTTAFYLVANYQTGVVRFANAGHPKPLILRRSENRIETLANACGHGQPALGLFEEPPYETSEATLAPGDFVMLFTDGLYEVQGANEELYSQQRLMVDVQHHFGEPAGELFDHLLETIRAFSIDLAFEDDVCLVGMEFAGRPSPKKS